MSTVHSQEMEALGRKFYRRKEKSLGLLVSNFLNIYNREGVDLIGLDDAAANLGVERRRIYDVVNILETIGLVARRGKSQYSWMGFGAVPRVLDQLKEEGMIEKIGIIPCVTNSEMVLYEQEREDSFKLTTLDDQENSTTSLKLDNKKEKILWLLAQNFVKLFLCSDADLITLDSVTKALLNETQEPLNRKTKIRRLYDIANVFSAVKLIEKTHMPESKKTAYRWLGFESMSENRLLAAGSSSLGDGNESKKRIFGIDISNLEAKRSKRYCFDDPKFWEKQKKSNVKKEQDCESKAAGKSSVSGSATPAADNNSDRRRGRLAEIEALASTYRPQYANPVLMGLFGHFKDTMKAWMDQARPK